MNVNIMQLQADKNNQIYFGFTQTHVFYFVKQIILSTVRINLIY